jgi:hypothetical protein
MVRASARGIAFSCDAPAHRPASCLCVFDETNRERQNLMQDEDIIPIEALDILRNASDELLRGATLGEIDLNKLAGWELRSRRRELGLQWVGALARSSEP